VVSNWINLNNLIITTQFSFPTPAQGTRGSIQCSDGKIATWEYDSTDDNGDKILIYDSSTGDDIQIAFCYAIPGRDIFMGLFLTGAIPSLAITDENCIYYRVDY
jgi:hypothetical protein